MHGRHPAYPQRSDASSAPENVHHFLEMGQALVGIAYPGDVKASPSRRHAAARRFRRSACCERAKPRERRAKYPVAELEGSRRPPRGPATRRGPAGLRPEVPDGGARRDEDGLAVVSRTLEWPVRHEKRAVARLPVRGRARRAVLSDACQVGPHPGECCHCVGGDDYHARFCSPAFRNRFHWRNG
jgi:hypothetical protein